MRLVGTGVVQILIIHFDFLGICRELLYQERPCDAKAEDIINAPLENNREVAFSDK